jgi:hypothetical protein
MLQSRIVHDRAGRVGVGWCLGPAAQRSPRGFGLLSFGVEASCLSWVCFVIVVGDLQLEFATCLVCPGRGYCLNNGVPFLKSF